MLTWWKVNEARFPLMGKVAEIVLATPASEAICGRLFKRAEHIGITDRMARLLDETFEMLVMAQYNIVRRRDNRGEQTFYKNLKIMTL